MEGLPPSSVQVDTFENLAPNATVNVKPKYRGNYGDAGDTWYGLLVLEEKEEECDNEELTIITLVALLAQKDEEIANKNERITRLEDLSLVSRFSLLLEEKDEQIAALELRPTLTEFDAVVTERDARPTLEEIQDARTGSVLLTPSEDGTVKLKIEIEESSDLSVWENNGESVEVELPLPAGKKFLRFALN
jgi:hypothetical protein